MKVLKKIVKEAKYYAVPDADDLDGQTEAILNMPAVQPVDVNIDDELGMIDDIESRATNLGSAYGDDGIEYEDDVVGGEEGCEECEDGEVYEITTTDPVCPCCGCKLVISDLPSEAEEDVDTEAGEETEDDVEVLDDEEDDEEVGEDDDNVEVIEDDEESEDDDEIEVIDDDEDEEEEEA